MRIGYFTHSLSGNGPRTRARSLITSVGEQTDHQPVVVTEKGSDYDVDDVEIHKIIDLTPIGIFNTLSRTNSIFNTVDLVHVPVNMKQAGFVRSVYSGPLVVGAGIQHELHYRIVGKLLSIDMVIDTHEYISYLWSKSGYNSTYVYPAVDETRFYEYENEQQGDNISQEDAITDNDVILFVGDLSEFKGAHLFKQLCLELSDENISGIAIGEGPLKSELQQVGNIHTLGFVKNEELPKYYNIADVTVVPSKRESFSLVSLESIACGTPVVTTTSSDCIMYKLFHDRGTYIWTSNREADSIRESVMSLITNDSRYQEQVQRGFNTIDEMGLTLGSTSEQMISIYEDVISMRN
jgi:glycosyltransferase involved in cell wall biosynthesis